MLASATSSATSFGTGGNSGGAGGAAPSAWAATNSIFNDLPTISEKSKFISSKVLISKGKQFSCKANYLLNKHLDNSEENVILSREFEKEIEFFKIYNEREESTTSPSIA